MSGITIDTSEVKAGVSKFQAKIIAGIKEKVKEAQLEEIEILKPKIKEVFTNSVDKFYDAYSPAFYTERRYTMRDLLTIESEGTDAVVARLDGNSFTGSSQTGYNLYNQVFKEGYHGGSKRSDGVGGYWYRPANHWSRIAVQTEAPISIFERDMNEFIATERNNYKNLIIRKIKELGI